MNRRFLFVLFFFIGIGVLFLHRALLGDDIALPGDILIGHYYPWRDYIWDGRLSGFPIKNFALNDAVVQFFPWRKFTVEQMSAGVIPFRNPYNFLGAPHMANIATAVFYPLTIIFYILPILEAWDIFIALQIILAGVFMYLYLYNLKLTHLVSLYGGVAYALSSFIVTTLELSVIGHTLLWAPLIMYSIDKLLETKGIKFLVLGVFALFNLFLAGFIQIAIYIYVLSVAYFIFRAKRRDYLYLGVLVFPLLLAMFQFLPFAETVAASSRITGYFENFSEAREYLMPARRLVGAIIPDYFGSPATGNFFGDLSYTEFAFYLGIPPVVFFLYALKFFKKNRDITFWVLVLVFSLVLLTRNPLSSLVHTLSIPIYSSLLPVRLLAIVTICVVVLSSFGIDEFGKRLKKSKNELGGINKLLGTVLAFFVFYIFDAFALLRLEPSKGTVSLRNIAIPFFVFVLTATSILLARKIYFKSFLYFLMFITVFDLTRQGWKYNTFIKESLIFPRTESLDFLGGQAVPPRVVMGHQELLPAEANVYFGFSLLGGYDSVHSAKTERLLNTLNYQDVDYEAVSGRVVFVSNLTSHAYDILSPEYYMLLSENEYKVDNMELLFGEGRTKVYKNLGSYPRVYVTKDVEVVAEEEILSKVLAMAEARERKAIMSWDSRLSETKLEGEQVKIYSDSGNEIVMSVEINTDAIVVMNEAYDPNWQAINMMTGESIELFEINFNLTGFLAPSGRYDVKLVYSPGEFNTGVKISVFSFFAFVGYTLSLKRRN